MKITKKQLKEIIKEELDEGIKSFMDKYVNRPKGTTFEFGPPKLGAPARRYSAARRRRKEKEAEKEELMKEVDEGFYSGTPRDKVMYVMGELDVLQNQLANTVPEGSEKLQDLYGALQVVVDELGDLQ